MTIFTTYETLRQIALTEFGDIVAQAIIHDGQENHVTASYLSDQPVEAIREFCTFARQKLLDDARSGNA